MNNHICAYEYVWEDGSHVEVFTSTVDIKELVRNYEKNYNVKLIKVNKLKVSDILSGVLYENLERRIVWPPKLLRELKRKKKNLRMIRL